MDAPEDDVRIFPPRNSNSNRTTRASTAHNHHNPNPAAESSLPESPPAAAGSLRELLESLRFDHEHSGANNDESGRVYGDINSTSNNNNHRGNADDPSNDDGDEGPDTTEDEDNQSQSTTSSNESYLDAGYDNEEDYLFDQYGGIGGTAEERASLAEALAHTLDVGPMADDLFYEEVAMCFLRCRERYKMRVWREERKRARRKIKREMQQQQQQQQQHSQHQSHSNNNTSGNANGTAPGGLHRHRSINTSEEEGEQHIKRGMEKMNMRDSGPVDSEYEQHDEDVDDSEVEPIVEGMRSVNVESDFEDVRAERSRRHHQRGGGGGAGKPTEDDDEFSMPSDTSPLGDVYDDVDDIDSFMMGSNKKNVARGSSGTSDDDDDGGDEFDELKNTERSSTQPYSDYEEELEELRAQKASMFVNKNGQAYSFGYGHEPNGPPSDDEDFFVKDPHGVRAEGEMERDDEDDTQYNANSNARRKSDLTDISGYGGEAPEEGGNNLPTFRVDLKTENKKKGKNKGGQRYPPPPPPPPPPRQHNEHTFAHDPGSPMDVDPEMEGMTYEEKLAYGARKAAEDSAAKNDHESLRKGFAIGTAGEAEKNKHKANNKHHHRPGALGHHPVSSPHKREKSFYGFDDATTVKDDITEVASDEEQDTAKRQQVSLLRDEGRSFYINGAYKESVLKYTEAIRVHTDNYSERINNGNDNTLAALYGNRAAALMMTGAYSGASADCNRALQCTAHDSTKGSLESGPAFRSKILCRMARALIKAGNVWEAENAFQAAGEAASQDMSALSRSGGNPEDIRQAEKILGQCQTDATLGLSDVKRYRDSLEGAAKITAESSNKGVNLATDRRNSVQLLMFINATLSVSPGSMELHERKVQALATLKRWAELGNHCERLAAEMVKIDGIFQGDLASLSPFPDVRAATSLKPDFFEKNPDDISDPPSLRILSPKAVCDAVLRLPNGILPLYLRSLRLEERYTEAAKAGSSIETHMSNSKHQSSRGNVSMQWLANERDKLRRTMSWKEKGDTLFRSGDYERAAAKYAQCLGIDGDNEEYASNPLDNEDAGGRLHAVLHCNRAACLMALKKYREAVKECTASLRIHTHYMKAMLRRGRCFARIRQYQEAVSEYERYIQLVDEAKRSPQSALNSNAACTFDRPIDITPSEYSKAKQELSDVKKNMKQATATAQTQKEKQTESQQWYNNNFRKAAAGNTTAHRRKQEAPGGQNSDTAQSRKQHWDATGSNTRRWDQFGGASPKKHNRKSKDAPTGGGTGPSTGPSASRKQSSQLPQPAPAEKNAFCHYSVLELNMTASSAEIKKAYHKMALKYHPDKNSEEGAADMFRRVKLAYEVLGNDDTRFAYDAEQRRRGRR